MVCSAVVQICDFPSVATYVIFTYDTYQTGDVLNTAEYVLVALCGRAAVVSTRAYVRACAHVHVGEVRRATYGGAVVHGRVFRLSLILLEY